MHYEKTHNTSFDVVAVSDEQWHPFDDIERFENELYSDSVIGEVLIINHHHTHYPRLTSIRFNGFMCDTTSARAVTHDQLNSTF